MSYISRRLNWVKYGIKNVVDRNIHAYGRHDHKVEYDRKIRDFLSSDNISEALLFVGMRQVRYRLGVVNPYEYIWGILKDICSTYYIPTFTPSVRITRVFDVRLTTSEVGAFSQKVLDESTYRTLSPLKSYVVVGNMDKGIRDRLSYQDFGDVGMYRYFADHRVSTINFGSNNLRLGCLHYVEYLAQVPYFKIEPLMIHIIDHQGRSHMLEYSDFSYTQKVKINLNKIENDLERNCLLRKLIVNGLIIRILPNQDYIEYLFDMVKKNPYYLVD